MGIVRQKRLYKKHRLTKRAADVWDSARFTGFFLALGFTYISGGIHARPPAATDYLQCQGWEKSRARSPARVSFSRGIFFFE